MAVKFIQAASANTTNVALSGTQLNDLIVVFAYNNASTTVPTVPAGYTSLDTATGTAEAGVLAFKVSPGSETSTGTWTNATNIVALVYRGASGCGASASSTGNSATLSYPTITLNDTSGNSWVAGLGGAVSATAGMGGTTAALTQSRTNQTTVNGLDTNATVTTFAAQSLAVTGSGNWLTFSVEIQAIGKSYVGLIPPAGGLCQNAKCTPFFVSGGGGPLSPVPYAQVIEQGTVGLSYSETISAVGGTSPYTFAVTAGSLPTGTTLNATTGVISGTTTVAGTYSFTITATDSIGNSGSNIFSITINVATSGGSFTFAA